ncbi:hypothetical protein [Rhizobium sp. WSM1325]|uniref:hypothetical protein n=1 Tax=Rhizobium sp. WSM1325 TaxID=3444086 RepID=UPI000FEFEC33|nr:hypothetical protein [Rhizobium leguminosarum]RWY75275.1 hypothetical protein EHI48_19030 [Rhizobium leguminosarum]
MVVVSAMMAITVIDLHYVVSNRQKLDSGVELRSHVLLTLDEPAAHDICHPPMLSSHAVSPGQRNGVSKLRFGAGTQKQQAHRGANAAR